VYFAAGVVITVLVSWVLALHAVPIMGNRGKENGAWPASAPEGWPARARYVGTCERRIMLRGLWYASAWGNHSGDSAGDYKMVVTRSGWPLLAMESRLRQTRSEFGRVHR
jgi:multidrug efflux pump subunit AcrB